MIIKPTTPKIYTPQDGSCVLNLSGRDVRGTKIYDRSGKNNHGAIIGAVLKPSNYGLPVLEFDGVDDYVNAGNAASTQIGTNATLEAWINFAASPTTNAILSKDVGAAANLKWIWWYDAGKMGLHFHNPAGTSFTVADSDWAPALNTWYCVVLVKSGLNFKFYRNGVQTATPSTAVDVPIVNFALLIGQAENTMRFNGTIDEVRIFNRAKSIQEEIEYFNRTKHLYGK